MTTLVKGDPAPSFRLPDQDGAIVGLEDYAGRRVVVYFYPADDTPGCTKEAYQFSDLVDEYAALGVEVLGISPDGGSKRQRFRAKYGLRIAWSSARTLYQARSFARTASWRRRLRKEPSPRGQDRSANRARSCRPCRRETLIG